MFRVALIGPESCGKTTFGRYLEKRYPNVTLLPEIERDYVEALDREVRYEDIEEIVRLQIAQFREIEALDFPNTKRSVSEDAGDGEQVYIFDAELVVLKVWFDVAFGHHPDYLDKEIAAHPMDCYLLFYPDLPWVSDKARTRGSNEERLALFHRYEQEIQALDIPYYIIRHTNEN